MHVLTDGQCAPELVLGLGRVGLCQLDGLQLIVPQAAEQVPASGGASGCHQQARVQRHTDVKLHAAAPCTYMRKGSAGRGSSNQ